MHLPMYMYCAKFLSVKVICMRGLLNYITQLLFVLTIHRFLNESHLSLIQSLATHVTSLLVHKYSYSYYMLIFIDFRYLYFSYGLLVF